MECFDRTSQATVLNSTEDYRNKTNTNKVVHISQTEEWMAALGLT